MNKETFTDKELTALYNILEYASKDISLEDEPLLNVLWDKLKPYEVLLNDN